MTYVTHTLCALTHAHAHAHALICSDENRTSQMRSARHAVMSWGIRKAGPTNVEDDGGKDVLQGIGAAVHDAGHLPSLAHEVELQVQVQRVRKQVQADAPAHTSTRSCAQSAHAPAHVQRC